MRSLAELKSFTHEAARILAREKDLASYEIYCTTAEHRIARLAYTSDIPSRGLEEFIRRTGADELMITTMVYDHAARRRSYELLAEAFDLPSAG